MKHVILTFENDTEAGEFMEQFGQSRGHRGSGQQNELLGLSVKDASSAEMVEVPPTITKPGFALTKIPQVILNLKKIENICLAPHWTASRRWTIRDIAHDTWLNF